jgi:hypothetical protein
VTVLSDGEDVSTTELLRRMGQALGRPARLMPVPAMQQTPMSGYAALTRLLLVVARTKGALTGLKLFAANFGTGPGLVVGTGGAWRWMCFWQRHPRRGYKSGYLNNCEAGGWGCE